MAGIEPASERIDPQISTSVVGCWIRQLVYKRQKTNWLTAGTRKLLFHTGSGIMCGTPTFWRPLYLRSEDGVGGREPTRGSWLIFYRLCSEGKSSIWSAIGTCVLHWFIEIGASRLAIPAQPLPAKPVIPGGLIILEIPFKTAELRALLHGYSYGEINLLKKKGVWY